MSTIGGLLFGNSPTPAVSTSSSTSGAPAWLQSFYQALLSQGSQAANNPYTPNPNPQVAPLTADQNTAYTDVENQVGAQQPLLNQATQDATNAAAPVTAAQINNYMSPYTSDVVNSIGDLAQRNLTQNLLPAVNDTFTGAGQFGSARNSQFTQQTIQQANESALNQQAQALESGYDTALGAAQTDQSRQLSAAGTLGNLASTSQQVGLQGDAALEAAGQSQQQNQQQNLDVENQNWLTQQQYPETQLSWLNTLFNPSGAGTTSTSTSSTTPSVQQPSALSQVAGALGGLGSLIGSLFKEGGAVRLAGGGPTSAANDDDGGDDSIRNDNAMLGNIQAEGEAAAAKPEAQRTPDEVAAIQRYAAAFGGAPGVVNRRQPPAAHQGFARGGKTRSVGSLRGAPAPVTPFADHIIIARRAQAALAKPAQRRNATDNHAIMTATLLARQSAPQQSPQASLGSLQRAA